MREELEAAVDFIFKSFFKLQDLQGSYDLQKLKNVLIEILEERYKNHWYENKPLKGQAYRCIRLRKNDANLDYVIDLLINKLKQTENINLENCLLKSDITLWVDPGEVCCR